MTRAATLGLFTLAAIGMLPFSGRLYGQSPPQFDVAVIRQNPAGAGAGTSFNLFEGGRLKITNEPVKLLIRAAFQLQNAQITGGPAWLETDRYDIEAKTGQSEKLAQEQVGPLLQSLLIERLALKYHREMRELPVLALVSERAQAGPPKLKPATDGETSAMNTHSASGKPQQLVAAATTLDTLASYIGNRLGKVVVNQSGLSSSYDFTLEWTPDDAADSSLPSLVTALHEQLGLKLEQQRRPVEVLVIDSLQRPSEN